MGRAQNRHSDSLTMLALSLTEEALRLIKVELIAKPRISMIDSVGITEVDVAMISTTGPCWMDPIIDFLAKDRVLDDEKGAKRI